MSQGVSEGLHAKVAITTSTKEIIAGNSDRRALVLQNKGSDDIHLAFGEDAVVDSGMILEAGSTMTFGEKGDFPVPVEAVNGITAAGSSDVHRQAFE